MCVCKGLHNMTMDLFKMVSAKVFGLALIFSKHLIPFLNHIYTPAFQWKRKECVLETVCVLQDGDIVEK